MDSYERNQTELFERLLEPHLQILYRFAFRLTHSRPEAEDLFQDVLAKVFARLEELIDVDDPRPWLCRVLYNQFVDNRRRYARQRLVTVEEGQLPGGTVDALPGDPEPGPEGSAERRDNIRRLEAALAMLSDEHRSVVLLHDAEGYKLEEIQNITGDPVGTIKSRLHRARRRLREILGADGTFSGPGS